MLFNQQKPLCQRSDWYTYYKTIHEPKGKGTLEKQIYTVRRVAKHLNLDIPENSLSDISNKVFSTNVWTFRKGQIGDWTNLFTKDLKELFKERVGNVLITLGYEKDSNW